MIDFQMWAIVIIVFFVCARILDWFAQTSLSVRTKVGMSWAFGGAVMIILTMIYMLK